MSPLYCTRCGTTFRVATSPAQARREAAEFYEVPEEQITQEDIDTMGCPGCGYISWIVPAKAA
jgi:ribosomal protein S27AE